LEEGLFETKVGFIAKKLLEVIGVIRGRQLIGGRSGG
jgi:hypothetical protein